MPLLRTGSFPSLSWTFCFGQTQVRGSDESPTSPVHHVERGDGKNSIGASPPSPRSPAWRLSIPVSVRREPLHRPRVGRRGRACPMTIMRATILRFPSTLCELGAGFLSEGPPTEPYTHSLTHSLKGLCRTRLTDDVDRVVPRLICIWLCVCACVRVFIWARHPLAGSEAVR